MNVNRSGYYKWKKRQGTLNRYEQDRQVLTELLKETHAKHKSYGYHRLAAVIRNETGWIFSDNLAHECCIVCSCARCESKYSRLVAHCHQNLIIGIPSKVNLIYIVFARDTLFAVIIIAT